MSRHHFPTVLPSQRIATAPSPQGGQIQAQDAIPYDRLLGHVQTKIKHNFGFQQIQDPDWTPVELSDAILAVLTPERWSKLEVREQKCIMDKIESSSLSPVFYSSSFPSVPYLILGLGAHAVNPKAKDCWRLVNEQTARDAAEWFRQIKSNLASRQYSSPTLLRLLKSQLVSIAPISMLAGPKRELEALLFAVVARWNAFEDGDNTRIAWVAAFNVVAAMSRLLADPDHSGLELEVSRAFYPTPDVLSHLCGFRLLALQDSTNWSPYSPQPRHNQGTYPQLRLEYLGQAPNTFKPKVGHLDENKVESWDDVRIAIGRVCLAYTLEPRYLSEDDEKAYVREDDRVKHLDPGWLAFQRLRWMTETLTASRGLDLRYTSYLTPDHINLLKHSLRVLLQRAEHKTLPSYKELARTPGKLEELAEEPTSWLCRAISSCEPFPALSGLEVAGPLKLQTLWRQKKSLLA